MTANSKDRKLPTLEKAFANQGLDLGLAGVEGLKLIGFFKV
jgi:hypothetical protein